MRDVNLPANFVPIEGGKILRVFDYFNLPDELFELIPADMPADILRDMLVSLIKGFTLTCICRMGWNGRIFSGLLWRHRVSRTSADHGL